MTLLANDLPASAPRLHPPSRPGRIPFFDHPESDLQMPFSAKLPAMVLPRFSEPQVEPYRAAHRIALIGGFTPRRCGIATFTADIYTSITAGFPDATVDVYAMAPATNSIAFAAPVCGVIVESDATSFVAAAAAIEASCADVVWLQHELGLFGGHSAQCRARAAVQRARRRCCRIPCAGCPRSPGSESASF